jgi:hypothetical protein
MNCNPDLSFQITGARRRLGLFALSLSLMVLAACGTTKVLPTNIAFAQGQLAPPSSAMAGSTVQFAAIVQNDTANLGVSWLLTCNGPISNCGTISRHTASGVPTTFIAPSSVPPGGTVTIQANSSSLPSQSVTATITITPTVYGPISVSFSPAPTPVTVNNAESLSIVVTNDHGGANGGPQGSTVTASCAVGGTCGSVVGSAVAGWTYLSPTAIPNGGTVTLTATSVADPTKSATATITITPPVVAISLVEPVPTSVAAGAAVNFAAFVKDGTFTDISGAAGIDWRVTCNASACGSFIPQHTANDSAATLPNIVTSYTAPTVVPPGATVTITASATADATKQASATLNVTATTLNNGLLKGQYAFLLNGVHPVGTSAVAGSIVADGNGNITGGEETLSGQPLPVTGITGSYFLGTDGRGLITLSGVPGSDLNWQNGQQILAVAVIDSNRAFIEEFDGSGSYNSALPPQPWFGRTLRGELELQQTGDFTVPPSGPYAFSFQHSGLTISGTSCSRFLVCAAYDGGVLDTDATGAISSFSMDRYVDGIASSIVSGAYGFQRFSVVDSFGHGTVNIGPYAFHYFLVDSGDMIVMASSSLDQTGLPTGHIYAQPGNATLTAGTYAFTSAGSFPLNSGTGNVVGSSPQTAGGWFTIDTNGNLSGYLDTNNNGAMLSATVTGSVVSGAINGRLTLTMTGGGASQFALYPTSSHGVLMLQLDNGRSGIGTVLSQTPMAGLLGNYAASVQTIGFINTGLNTAAAGLPVGTWTDISGQLGASASSTLSGTLDIDQVDGTYLGPAGNFWTQLPGQSATGTFAVDSAGRAIASIETTLPSTTQAGVTQVSTISVIFYVVNPSTVLVMETDATPAVGLLQIQSF